MSVSCRVPKYGLHRGSRQALVQINGERIYLGKYGTDESREKYRHIVTELMAGTPAPTVDPGPGVELTITEVINADWKRTTC